MFTIVVEPGPEFIDAAQVGKGRRGSQRGGAQQNDHHGEFSGHPHPEKLSQRPRAFAQATCFSNICLLRDSAKPTMAREPITVATVLTWPRFFSPGSRTLP